MSFRQHYRGGVDAFYRTNGAAYRNPHEDRIRAALTAAVLGARLQLHDMRVLDFACGSGEVTRLLAFGAKDVVGCDPYTEAAYRSRIGKRASFFEASFQSVVEGALEGVHYNLTVCSYALHLCPPSMLPAFLYQLSRASDRLLIASPHKRPVIDSPHWTLQRSAIVERVHTHLLEAARCSHD